MSLVAPTFDPNTLPFSPIPAPTGHATPLKLSVIRAGLLECKGALFVEGWPDETPMKLEDYSYLVEKENGTKFVWDLGLRKNNAYNPELKKQAIAFQSKAQFATTDVLKDAGCDLASISAVVFSHNHFDHTADISPFPKTTELIMGPRNKHETLDELAKELSVEKEILEDRKITYLNKDEGKWVDIGCFKGLDYFGDSSLFFLSTPGHYAGALSCLILTSSSPPIYHLLGGDTAHHISLLRGAKAGSFKNKENIMSPEGADPEAMSTFESDLEASVRAQAGLGALDALPNVVVWLAHDRSMVGPLQAREGVLTRLDGGAEEMQKYKKRTEEDYRGKEVIFGEGGKRVEMERNLEKNVQGSQSD